METAATSETTVPVARVHLTPSEQHELGFTHLDRLTPLKEALTSQMNFINFQFFSVFIFSETQ